MTSSETTSLPTTPIEFTDALFASIVVEGELATKRGKPFEKIFEGYARISSDFAADVDKVQRFEDWVITQPDWVGLPWDLGIDYVLTFKEEHKKPVPVQVKFRSDTITKDAMDALIAQVMTHPGVFSDMVIVSSVYFKDHSRDLVKEANRIGIKLFGREWFDQINRELMESGKTPPTTIQELRALLPASEELALDPLELRPHQERLRAHTLETLSTSDRTTIHSACGTGKTLTAWSLFNDLVPANGVGMIFAPALSLVDATGKAFKRQQTAHIQYDILAVCSDKTVNRDASETIQAVEIDIDPSTLHANVSSDPEEIREWLRSPADGRRKVLISTYQSSDIVKAAVEGVGIASSLTILDEAHRLAGTGTFGQSVWDIAGTKVISMTATPRVTTLKKSGSADNVSVVSMSDADKFGDQAQWSTYSISEGIADGVLAPYSIEIIVTPHAEDVNSRTRIDNKGSDARMLALLKTCTDVYQNENGGQGAVVTFFNTVKNSEQFVKFAQEQMALGTVPQLKMHHIDGTTPMRKRLTATDDIRTEGGVLSNVAVLNEGVDLPYLSAVMFAEHRSSKTDIIQAMGRVMRRDPNNPNKVGRIIIPVAVDADADTADIESILAGSSFNHVWAVIKAVADHDDTLLEDMIEIRRALVRGERPRQQGSFHDKVQVIINGALNANHAWDDEEFASVFMESLSTKVVRTVVSNWYEWLEVLTAFVDQHGRGPKRDDVFQSVRIGVWCGKQRQRKKKGGLSAEQISALENIPGWFWTQQDLWYENLEVLIAFVNQQGRIPKQKETFQGVSIGIWCSKQRERKKEGSLSAEQITSLESTPGWLWKQQEPLEVWYENLAVLVAFVEQHGRLPAWKEIFQGVRIATWCDTQRQRKGGLSAEQITSLESIPGWFWRHLEVWYEKLEVLTAFVDQHGRAPKSKETFQSFYIGAWCSRQRERKKEGSLSAEQISTLENTSRWFWKQDHLEVWYKNFEVLIAFVNQHGRAPKQREIFQEVRIGAWTKMQRDRKSGLNSDQISALENIPGWFWSMRLKKSEI